MKPSFRTGFLGGLITACVSFSSVQAHEFEPVEIIRGDLSEIDASNVMIDGAQVVFGDLLALKLVYSGCNPVEHRLITDNQVKESWPPQMDFVLVEKNDPGACQMIIEDVAIFLSHEIALTGPALISVNDSKFNVDFSKGPVVRVSKSSEAMAKERTALASQGGSPKNSGDDLSISKVEVFSGLDRFWLRALVSYSGGCTTHEFDLQLEQYIEPFPPEAHFYLEHNANGDTCRRNFIDEPIEVPIDGYDFKGPTVIKVRTKNSPHVKDLYDFGQ